MFSQTNSSTIKTTN